MTDTLTAAPSLGTATAAGAASSINFASAGPQQLTGFSRASSGTYIDVNGVLQTALTDQPRIDYSSGSPQLLVEGAATNYCPNSNLITPQSSPTVTANAALAPDGTMTATLVSGTGAILSQSASGEPLAGNYTMSFWVKGASSFVLAFGATYHNPSLVSGASANVSITTSWQRVVLPSCGVPSGATVVCIKAALSSTPTFYIWGCQIEAGTSGTSLIQTNGTTASRAADLPVYTPTTGPSLGSLYSSVAVALVDAGTDASSLGALSAAATGSFTILASATGTLGALSAFADSIPTANLSAAPSLGGFSALLTATEINLGTQAASLGLLVAQGNLLGTDVIAGAAGLPGLLAHATGASVNPSHGAPTLGSVSAQGNALGRDQMSARVSLGTFMASVITTLTALGTGVMINPSSLFPPKLGAKRQDPNLGSLIDLFTLDMTSTGGPLLRWTPGTYQDQMISFGGIAYQPLPIQMTGLEWTTKGAIPQPKLQISNIYQNTAGYATALVIAYGDLVGAIVTRLRTYDMFLDGRPYADSTAYEEPAIFRVNRKSAHKKDTIEFELASVLDQQGRMLPGRQIIRDTCTHSYRSWNGSMFIAGSCPYSGSSYFDQNGNPVGSPSADVCGFRLGDCLLRFGTAPLPTRAFPGVARTQV